MFNINCLLGENVTFEDWKSFKEDFEKLPRLDTVKLRSLNLDELQEAKRRVELLSKVAKNVAKHLPFDQIVKDPILAVAYSNIGRIELFL